MIVNLAVDIGTGTTTIYRQGSGLVLKEPTLIAMQTTKKGDEVRAAGNEAKELLGKAGRDIKISSPIKEAEIKSAEMLTLLLKTFFTKILGSNIAKAKINAIAAVPVGSTTLERINYKQILKDAGVNDVYLVESVFASANYLNLFPSVQPAFIVSMGQGSCNFAVIDSGGDVIDRQVKSIVQGCTINVGGNLLNWELVNFLAENQRFEVMISAAETARVDIGTLDDKDTASTLIRGRNLQTSSSAEFRLTSSIIREAIVPSFAKVCYVIGAILKSVNKQTAEWIVLNGIHINGGLSQTHGLPEFLKEKLGVNVLTCEDPTNAIAIGAGMMWDKLENFRWALK